MSSIFHAFSILHPLPIIQVSKKQEEKIAALSTSPQILQINLNILQHISIWLMLQIFWD
jgi:hypothetical protein